MEYVLQTNNLTKMYGKKAAVNGVDLHVKEGDIYGLIGKNGAGKTTLIRMVAGIANPSSGNIRLFESDDLDTQRRKTRVMIENPAVYLNMTARQNLMYYCYLLGIKSKNAIDEMLHLVGLTDTGKKKARNFSLGMKQRLAIAIALMGDPEFLMLDEPMNGLDPTGIKEIRELILKLNQEKHLTILISSHILGELSKIATRYGVINKGQLIEEFSNQELLERCESKLELKVDNTEKAAEILKSRLSITNYNIVDESTIHILKDFQDKVGQINTELATHGVTVFFSSIVGEDLEDYFMQLMSRTYYSIT